MKEYRYRIEPCSQRDESLFHHPDPAIHNTRVTLFFIRDHPDYGRFEDDDCPAEEESPFHFTYYSEEPGFPTAEEAVAFLKQYCLMLVTLYCKARGPSGRYQVLGYMGDNYDRVELQDVQDFINETATPTLVHTRDLVDFVGRYKYLYYSACKAINVFGCSIDGFNIFENQDDLFEWIGYEEE